MLDNSGHKHTLRICNTNCFSTARMVTRRRLSVMWYAHCLCSFRCLVSLLCREVRYGRRTYTFYTLFLQQCSTRTCEETLKLCTCFIVWTCAWRRLFALFYGNISVAWKLPGRQRKISFRFWVWHWWHVNGRNFPHEVWYWDWCYTWQNIMQNIVY